MGDKRLSNVELRLSRLEDEDPPRDENRGILELFDVTKPPPDEDQPLQRDPGE
jgi:hypothetical protein